MPAFVKFPPDSNVTLEAASSRRFAETCRVHHLYLALGALVLVFLAIRLVLVKLRVPRLTSPRTAAGHKQQPEQTREQKDLASLDNYYRGGAVCWSSSPSLPVGGPSCPYFSAEHHGTEFRPGSSLHEPGLAVGLLPQTVQPGVTGASWLVRAMDGDASGKRKDRSGSATSRGVSTNEHSATDIRRQLDPSRGGSRSGSRAEGTRYGRSSRPSASQASSSRRPSGSANGADSSGSTGNGEGHGKEPMTRQDALSQGVPGTAGHDNSDPSRYGDDFAWLGPSENSTGYSSVDYTTLSWDFSRPAPPAPLTPPTLSDPIFPFESRRPSFAISIPPELDGAFIHEGNPDYYGIGSSSADISSSSPQSTIDLPRRRSYTRSVPIGIPTPTASASSSAEAITSPSTFSPSTFPPSGPIFPPPPPGSDLPYDYQFVGGPGGPGIFYSEEMVDLHGEILSAVDEAGHCWTRHTRVYGGGVCLACIGAGGEGGFYGDKVPLEDRR